MKRLLFCFALLLGQTAPQPISVPIQNASFETAVDLSKTTDCGPYYTGPTSGVPGWNAGAWNSSSGIGILQPTCIVAPDGKQVLVLQNTTAYQVLGDVSKMPFADANGGVDGTFTMHVFVANRFYWYPGRFSASLSLFCQPGNALCSQGTTETLCSTSGVPRGDFTDIPLVCPSQRQYGILTVAVSAAGYALLVDNVSLKFTSAN